MKIVPAMRTIILFGQAPTCHSCFFYQYPDIFVETNQKSMHMFIYFIRALDVSKRLMTSVL
jgi:hypothetical protein